MQKNKIDSNVQAISKGLLPASFDVSINKL